METETIQALGVAFGGAFAGVIGTLVAAWVNRRKTKAEAGQVIAMGADEVVGSALSLVKEMRLDVATLKERVTELEEENRQLRDIVEAQGHIIADQGRTIARLEKELELYHLQPLDEKDEEDSV